MNNPRSKPTTVANGTFVDVNSNSTIDDLKSCWEAGAKAFLEVTKDLSVDDVEDEDPA